MPIHASRSRDSCAASSPTDPKRFSSRMRPTSADPSCNHTDRRRNPPDEPPPKPAPRLINRRTVAYVDHGRPLHAADHGTRGIHSACRHHGHRIGGFDIGRGEADRAPYATAANYRTRQRVAITERPCSTGHIAGRQPWLRYRRRAYRRSFAGILRSTDHLHSRLAAYATGTPPCRKARRSLCGC